MNLTTMNARCTGKTTAICSAAKAVGATVICVDEKQAMRLRKQFGVKAISMRTQDRARVGHGGSFIWDHFAADMAWDEFSAKLEVLQKKYRNLKDNNVRLRKEITELKREHRRVIQCALENCTTYDQLEAALYDLIDDAREE